MEVEEFARLRPGDLVRHKGGSDAYVVVRPFPGGADIQRSRTIHNHREWDIVGRGGQFVEASDAPSSTENDRSLAEFLLPFILLFWLTFGVGPLWLGVVVCLLFGGLAYAESKARKLARG